MKGAGVSPVAPRRQQTWTEGASGNETHQDGHKQLSRNKQAGLAAPSCREAGHEPLQAGTHNTQLHSPLWPRSQAGSSYDSQNAFPNTGNSQIYLLTS